MEKEHKLKNRIAKLLPKAVAAVRVTFQNPPLSPGRDHTRWSKQRGSSMISMIPAEARTRSKDVGGSSNIDSRDPTSPKVSCMGQIKHKKKQIKKAKSQSVSLPKNVREVRDDSSALRRIFHGSKHPDGAAAATSDHGMEKEVPPPALASMKRFASGRNSLTDFDWKPRAPAEDMDHNGYFSDQDREESDAEEEIIIPFSAPIMVGGGYHGERVPLKPRKEINLWKRRTMTPPRPLQLKPVPRPN